MQRRKALKQLVYATGAVLLLPSCMQHESRSSMLLNNISINSEQEELMEALTDRIIPSTDTPGAKDVSAHLFALMMIDDCYVKEDQQRFIAGLKAFEEKTKKQCRKSFAECTITEKDSLLNELEEKKSVSPELIYFYSTCKKLSIQAYTTSKFYLTKVQVYQLVPGHYYGCVPVKRVS